MSTALLKFKPSPAMPAKMPIDPSILVGAMEACPEPMAVIENGKVIYGNRSFAQLPKQMKGHNIATDADDSRWRATNFSLGSHKFVVATLKHEAEPETVHLAMLGRLVGGVAHDFNNQLTGILLYCDLMKTKLSATSPLAPKIEEIRRAADQGAGLIRQLMTVGREEKGAPRWVSFNHAIEEMLPLLRHLAGEDITIALKLEAGAPRVGISLAEAQQVILNLVLNARDAMPGGGTVSLETRLLELDGAAQDRSAQDRSAQGRSPQGRPVFEFAVADSGHGMDAEAVARIFEPFYTTKVLGGTGMGLATVKRIAEQSGGAVSVDTAPGRGTRMAFRLAPLQVPNNPIEEQQVQNSLPLRPKRAGVRQSQSLHSENRGASI